MKKTNRTALMALVLVGGFFILALPAMAATTITSTAAGGEWDSASTWIGGQIPSPDDAVVIATDPGHGVNITSAVDITQTDVGSITVNSGKLYAGGNNNTFGSLTINSDGYVKVSRSLTVLGATNISGTVNIQPSGPATDPIISLITFVGDVTLNNGAIWDEQIGGKVPNIIFGGNLINNATTFAIIPKTNEKIVNSFNGTDKTISGATPMVVQYLTINGTITNEGNLTVTNDLAGSGTLINGIAGVLNDSSATIDSALTITDALTVAKSKAHAALNSAFATYTETDYATDTWVTLTGFKTAGDSEIDAATDLAGVSSAQGTAIAGMAGVQSIAQTPVTPAVPTVTNDDTANTVSGMAAGMEFNLDDAGYIAYDQTTFTALDFSGNHTLLVRVAAVGINPASGAVTLTFTTNPVVVPPVSGGGGGGGGYYTPAPIIAPTIVTTTTTATTSVLPTVNGTTGAPAGQVLGVVIYNFTKNLGSGSHGSDVKALQQFLIDNNAGKASQALGKVGASGYFGSLTRAALAEYQKSVGIKPASGNFGAITRAYLANLAK